MSSMAPRTLPALPTEIIIRIFVETEGIANLTLACRTLYTVWEEHKEVIIQCQTPCYDAGRDLAIIQFTIASSTTTKDNFHALRSKKLSQQPSLINIIHANTADATALITAIEHSLLPKRLTCTRPSCRDRSTTLTSKEKDCITLAHHLLRAFVLLKGWGLYRPTIYPLREPFQALIWSLGPHELQLLRGVFLFIIERTGGSDDGKRGRETNGFSLRNEGVSNDYLYRRSDKGRCWLACMWIEWKLSYLVKNTAYALCCCKSEAILGGREVLLPTSFLDRCLE